MNGRCGVPGRVLDCTVRDGGFANGWAFSSDFVRDLYVALDEAGVDYMEVGFANARERWETREIQPWQSVTEELLQVIVPRKRRTRLAAMVDTWGLPNGEILDRSASRLDLVRVAARADNLEQAAELVGRFHRAGYETSLNLLAVSTIPSRALDGILSRIADSPGDVVYVVDSYGALDPHEVARLVERFRRALPGFAVGFHGHNNRQLALANSLVAVECGATLVDASLLGMGRGAGNCPLELLLGFFDSSYRTLVPLLNFVERHREAFAAPSRWAYSLPLMLTGILNRHPREATQDLIGEFLASRLAGRDP